METYFKGDEIRFRINIEAEGFSMDTDPFDIEVFSTSRGSIKASKGDPKLPESPLIIFSEEVTVQPEGDDPQAEPQTAVQWYGIVDTTTLGVGTLRTISTAYVTDVQANDGVRREIAVDDLCYLKDAKK